MISLFVLQSTEGWVTMMYEGMDVTYIDFLPEKNANVMGSLYFMVSIMLFNLFFLNLYVGVVTDTFNRQKEMLSRNHELPDETKEWVETQLLIMKSKPKIKHIKTGSFIRDFFLELVRSHKFENFIMWCILANTIVLSLTWVGQPEWTIKIVLYGNEILSIIFLFECLFKMYAFRLNYFKDPWNVFDFVIVFGGYAFALIGGSVKNTSSVLRCFKIGRIFRIAESTKNLNTIFKTLINTLPSLGSVGVLLILLFFMYAIIGCNYFASTMILDPEN